MMYVVHVSNAAVLDIVLDACTYLIYNIFTRP